MELLLNQHPALGTTWWVEAEVTATQRAEITNRVVSHLSQFETRYSRFLPDSLVSQLNTTGEITNPDPEFLTILTYGQSLYERTFGHFNFLVGNVLVARGYGQPDPQHTDDVVADPRSHLTITSDKVCLTAGSVDLGGFGKGYAIDELANILREFGTEHFLINGGGDLYGTSEPDGRPITIHLEHPTMPQTYLGTTTIFHQGFAASSPYKRTWKKDGVEHHHIVGTTTAASFITAPNARTADAFATSFLLANDTEIAAMHEAEQLGSARYYPETSQISAYNFPLVTS